MVWFAGFAQGSNRDHNVYLMVNASILFAVGWLIVKHSDRRKAGKQ